MRKGIFAHVLIAFLTNAALGNFNNEQEQEKVLQVLNTVFNDAALLRKSRHVELATETTLTHVLDTIALSYPDLKYTKGQNIEQIKDQIRRKLRYYLRKRQQQKRMNRPKYGYK